LSKESTSNNIPAIHTATEKEANEFDISTHCLSLMWDEPFFAHILRPVTKIKTEKIPTAGVLSKDGTVSMWWNPNFLASLTARKVKGLLKHECYHLIFEHTTARKNEPHIIWNYATDLAINSVIPEDELPESGLIPGNAFPDLKPEQMEKMSNKDIERYNLISSKIESFPKEMSSEWYFSRLLEDEEVSDAIKEQADSDVVYIGMDDHDGWGEMSEEDRELIRGKIRQIVEEAAKTADSSNGWGSIPASMRSKIREMISNQVDWRSVLRSAVGNKKRAGRDTSIRRLNRKYPGVFSGIRRKYTSSWAVYVDQSGSVGDEALEMLFGELSALAKHTSFDVYYFDTEVDEENMFTWKKGSKIKAGRTRCGGTDFKAPTEHAKKHKEAYDGFMVLTDGWAPDPGPASMRRVWVVTPNGELQFQKGRDVLIQMTNKKIKDAA